MALTAKLALAVCALAGADAAPKKLPPYAPWQKFVSSRRLSGGASQASPLLGSSSAAIPSGHPEDPLSRGREAAVNKAEALDFLAAQQKLEKTRQVAGRMYVVKRDGRRQVSEWWVGTNRRSPAL